MFRNNCFKERMLPFCFRNGWEWIYICFTFLRLESENYLLRFSIIEQMHFCYKDLTSWSLCFLAEERYYGFWRFSPFWDSTKSAWKMPKHLAAVSESYLSMILQTGGTPGFLFVSTNSIYVKESTALTICSLLNSINSFYFESCSNLAQISSFLSSFRLGHLIWTPLKKKSSESKKREKSQKLKSSLSKKLCIRLCEIRFSFGIRCSIRVYRECEDEGPISIIPKLFPGVS